MPSTRMRRTPGGGDRLRATVPFLLDSTWRQQVVGTLGTLVALGGLTALLVALHVPHQAATYTFLYLAVVVAAAITVGAAAALVGSVASALLVDYYLLAPVGRLTIYSTSQTIGWVIFLLVCMGVAFLASARRRYLHRLRAAVSELHQADAELRSAQAAREASLAARTELARTEAALAATRRADDFRRDLVATVSHELRTPLSALLGYSTALSDGRGLNQQQRQEYPLLIASEARRMDRLIGDLLELARIESGQLHVDVEVMDLGEAVREAGRRWIDRLMVRVEVPEEPILVLADWDRVQQVLDNGLRNVELHAGTRHVEILGSPISTARRTTAECVIADHGAGIPPELHEHLFEYYSGTRTTKGLGLGLAVSRGLVEAMGGALWVDAPTDGGTALHLLLPRAARASVEAEARS